MFANRGLAGIDGTTSTATGIALGGRQETTVLMGDVTFLHDAGGLLLGAGETEPQLRIVVLNDAGGAIFGLLEHGAVAAAGRYGDAVERLFATPQQVDLAALAAAYGVAHRRVGTTAELAEALSAPLEGRSIIEVRTDRHGLRALHGRIRAAVGSAVAGVSQARTPATRKLPASGRGSSAGTRIFGCPTAECADLRPVPCPQRLFSGACIMPEPCRGKEGVSSAAGRCPLRGISAHRRSRRFSNLDRRGIVSA